MNVMSQCVFCTVREDSIYEITHRSSMPSIQLSCNNYHGGNLTESLPRHPLTDCERNFSWNSAIHRAKDEAFAENIFFRSISWSLNVTHLLPRQYFLTLSNRKNRMIFILCTMRMARWLSSTFPRSAPSLDFMGACHGKSKKESSMWQPLSTAVPQLSIITKSARKGLLTDYLANGGKREEKALNVCGNFSDGHPSSRGDGFKGGVWNAVLLLHFCNNNLPSLSLSFSDWGLLLSKSLAETGGMRNGKTWYTFFISAPISTGTYEHNARIFKHKSHMQFWL